MDEQSPGSPAPDPVSEPVSPQAPAPEQDDSRVGRIAELIRRMCIADGNVVIYGIEHPLAVQSMRQAYEWLLSLLDERNRELSLVINDDRLLFQGFPVETRNAQVNQLIKRLDKLHINNLCFSLGIPEEEYAAFHELLSMREDEIEAQGGVKALLELAGVQSIVIRGATYVLLDEDDRVVGKDSTVVEGLASDDRRNEIVRYMLEKVIQESERKEWLLNAIKNDPRQTAAMIADGIARAFDESRSGNEEETIQSLVENIKLVGYNLIDEDTGEVRDGEESLEEAILELEKEVQNRAQQLMNSKETRRFLNEILSVVTTYTDQVKAKRITREFLKGEHNLKTTEKMLKEFSGRREAGEDLLVRLRDAMLKQGMQEEDLHTLIQQIKAKPKRRRRKKSFDQALHDGIAQRVKSMGIEDERHADTVDRLTTFFENKLKEKEKAFRTEQERLEGSVTRREHVLDDLVNAPVVVWDENGTIEYMNAQAAERIDGEVGLQLSPRAFARLQIAEPDDTGSTAEGDGQLTEEETRLLAAVASVLRDDNGHPLGAVLHAADAPDAPGGIPGPSM